MKIGLLILAAVAALGSVLGAAATAAHGQSGKGPSRVNAAAAVGDGSEASSNWSGYVSTGLGSTPTTASATTQFKRVTATWKQPAATCTGNGTSAASATWVGLGGYSVRSTSLEQAGTSADCSAAGRASYYAWYELVPDPAVTIKLKINPGDTITASVVINDTDVLLWLKNRTRNTVFSKHVTLPSPDLTSAEWIAEAPSECASNGNCRQIPLANFGSVTFTKIAALATIEGLGDQGGTIASPLWQSTAVRLVPRATQRFFGDVVERPDSTTGSAGATPAGLTPDGGTFSVNWVANASATG
jgi:hypothetical protein